MKTNDTEPREEGETTGTARRPKQHLAEAELTYELAEESITLIAEARSASDGRAAKTLAKHPGMNTVLTALRQGTFVRRHQASGPVLIQVISGTVRVELPDKSVDLQSMGLITLADNVAHQVEAVTDASFVIAIAAPHPPISTTNQGAEMSTISTKHDLEATPQLANRGTPLVGHSSDLAEFTAAGFGRRVLFDTERFRVILAALEPDQEIPIHAPAVDLAVAVLEGTGDLLAGDAVYDLRAGNVAVIPAGQSRGLRARGGRLVALHVVSPPPTTADHAAVTAGAAWPASEATADPGAAIDAEHAELLPHLDHLRDLAMRVDEVDEPALVGALDEILGFLRDGILPHADAEEKVLYPEIDSLLRAAGGATATMSMDHREIGRLVQELAAAQARTGGVDREGARRLLYSLEAILRLHFSKETEVYLPLLRRLSGREAAALLAGLAATPGGHHH